MVDSIHQGPDSIIFQVVQHPDMKKHEENWSEDSLLECTRYFAESFFSSINTEQDQEEPVTAPKKKLEETSYDPLLQGSQGLRLQTSIALGFHETCDSWCSA